MHVVGLTSCRNCEPAAGAERIRVDVSFSYSSLYSMNTGSLPRDDAEAVLAQIEESGSFDELREQLMSHLRDNKEVLRATCELIVASKQLPLPTDDKRTKQLASEAIRRELTAKVQGLMVAAVWEEMDGGGSELAKAIQEQSHYALCKVYEERELGGK